MFNLTLFVYGTLKRGYWNHDHFCRGALDIQEAMVLGRLYELPSGIPVLQAPKKSILAVGTKDISADMSVQEQQSSQHAIQHWKAPEAGEVVCGEMLIFDDPAQRIPPIDRLEGFRPGYMSMYRRVLVPVFTGQEITAAWVYIADSEEIIRSCRHLTGGRWEHESRVR